MHRKGTIVAVGLAVLAAGTLAQAQAQETNDARQTQGPRQGIKNARAAGINVDRAAEDAMAFAPVGSCLNDPSQAKCPRVKRVVHVDLNANGVSRKAKARAAAAPICTLRAEGPFKAAGYAQANAHHDCASRVTHHELYSTLYKRYNGVLYQMDVKADSGSNQVLNAYPNYRCTATVDRWWRHTYVAYTDFQGKLWAAGPIEESHEIPCG